MIYQKIIFYYHLLIIDNFNQLINKEISIIQYPWGIFKYSYGKIKNMTYTSKYEFAHDANTD